MRASTVTALVGGAALGWVCARSVRRLGGRGSVIGAGAALVTAAVIYPAARRDHAPSAALAVEGAVVAATTGLAIAAATTDVSRGRRWLAAGWAAHALFDAGLGPSEDSRLPGWYAPVCAGFDFAYAARLASSGPTPRIPLVPAGPPPDTGPGGTSGSPQQSAVPGS